MCDALLDSVIGSPCCQPEMSTVGLGAPLQIPPSPPVCWISAVPAMAPANIKKKKHTTFRRVCVCMCVGAVVEPVCYCVKRAGLQPPTFSGVKYNELFGKID